MKKDYKKPRFMRGRAKLIVHAINIIFLLFGPKKQVISPIMEVFGDIFKIQTIRFKIQIPDMQKG